MLYLGFETRNKKGARVRALMSDDSDKSKQQLIDELNELRQRVTHLEAIEDTLHQNQERHLQMFERNKSVKLIIDPETGDIVESNPAASEFYGYSKNELTSMKISEINQLSENEVKEEMARAKCEDRNYFMFQHQLASGEIRDVEVFSSPIAEDDKIFLYSIIHDITPRVQSQKILDETNARLVAILRAIPDFMFVIDIAGRFYQYWVSDDELLYVSPDIFLGKTISEIFPADVTDIMMQAIEQANHTETSVSQPYRLQYGDEYRWYELSVSKQKTLNETENFFIALVRDISQRYRDEEHLRQLYQAIEQSPNSIVITDINGIIEYVNPNFTHLSGYTSEEVIGQNPRILQSGYHSTEFYKDLWETILSGKEWRGEFCNKKKNGDIYWEYGSISSVRNNDGIIIKFIAIKEDITQTKLLAEEKVRQERLAAIGQLAAGIAHDFNNVMAIISLNIDLLKLSRNVAGTDGRRLEIIQKQALHASELIQQILDFSRSSIRNPQPLNLLTVLKEIIKFMEYTIPERIKLKFSYTDDDFTSIIDPAQLQQVMTNLAVNAQDAIRNNGDLHLHLTRASFNADNPMPVVGMEPGEWIVLSTTDTGSGIAPEDLAHIFEPFYTTKPVGKGTGLGLSQVYGIVKQHNGYITVESEPDVETTFTIYLPALESKKIVEFNVEDQVLHYGHGETLLLVEDNEDLLETLQDILEMLNYKIISAGNGIEALNIYQQNTTQINLILTDVVMPQMDGITFIQNLLEDVEPFPPIVLMSGFPRDRDIPDEVKQSVAGQLAKPIDNYQLAQLLWNILR